MWTETEMAQLYKDDASALFRCPDCDFEWRICEIKGCKLQAFREVWIKVRDSLGIPPDLKRVRFVCLDHYAELPIDNGE